MCQILDDNYYSEKYLIQTRSQAKTSGIKLLGSPWHGKEFRSQSETRKVACHFQTREYGKATCRSGEELDQEEIDLTPSINQLINHQMCHRKFLEEQK